MDITSTLDLQFLDLSEVDEFERNRVLSSLYSDRQGDDFPWFIGGEKSAFVGPKRRLKKRIATLTADQNTYHQFENHTHPPINQHYGLQIEGGPISNHYFNAGPFLPPMVPVPIQINPQNYGTIPVSTVYANFEGKSPIYYGVPPPQQIFVKNHSTVMEPYYGNDFIRKEYIEENSPTQIRVNDEINANGDLTSSAAPDFQSTVPPQSAVDNSKLDSEEMDKKQDPTPWAQTKTWASLFVSKTEPTVNSTVNGTNRQTHHTEAVKRDIDSGGTSCPFKNPKKGHFVDPDCYRMGEFLASYKVDGRAVSLQPRGLINQSNYCYVNSILQALIACPPMYNLLSGLVKNISSNEKRKPTPVIDGICKFVKEFAPMPANMRVVNRRSEGTKNQQKKEQGVIINTDVPFEPAWIYRMLNGIRTDLIEGRQEDAEEFLCCLLNNLNDEMLELIKLVKGEEPISPQPNRAEEEDKVSEWQVMGSKNKGSVLRKTVVERTPITDIFGGSLKSRIHRTGDQDTENTQPFFTLQLNIEKVKTVREALDALITKNQLEGVTSSKTNEAVEAWQQVMLDELPIILVLHLKCFDFKLDGCAKILKALEFPIDLKIDSKLISSKNATAKEKHYKLFAVVYHDGKEATKGHYVTDAFHVGYSSWLRYDDASVKQVQEEQVLKPQGTRVPYLLFYRRSDTIRR
ncbi:ubiquitin carboxyl-terminal hydrolase 10-A [Cylas formicarius]|uniref:ubiquitin carboxyl-terminal hydrolase 10-A n=1 Tax=Cylas formicarius TaxID=197179 RepID=UPI002958D30C|nr:ubiquitin carboxyl-terminal hydrolase 10-A [Cylas formicarius]